ncbi:MAG: hypothetical protein LAN71_17025 [Acidobacteriia bacterium]|nr:hypothetical protein [Terriglobia bacterium]
MVSEEIRLIGKEEMNNAVSILKPGSTISIGNEKRGYTITIGSEGILPENSIKYLKKVDQFHNKLGDIKISSLRENDTRNEQLRVSNGIDIELKNNKKMDLEPINALGKVISGEYNSRIKTNNNDNAELRNVILGWRNSFNKELDEKNRIKLENAAINRKLKDAEISEVEKQSDIIEKQKVSKIEERKNAERDVLEKERELSKICKKIDEEKEKSGNGDKEKELDSLEQQKISVISDIEVAKNNLEDKRINARSVALTASGVKGELLKLKMESTVVDSEPLEELVEVKDVNVAIYTEWEVENINMVPDEFIDMVRVVIADKINKAFEKYGGYYDIPGIKINRKQILRAKPKFPDEF